MSLRNDTRGAMTFHLIVFIGTLVIGAFLWVLVEPITMDLLEMAESGTSTEEAADGQGYIHAMVANIHFIVVGYGILQLLAAAVYEGRIG